MDDYEAEQSLRPPFIFNARRRISVSISIAAHPSFANPILFIEFALPWSATVTRDLSVFAKRGIFIRPRDSYRSPYVTANRVLPIIRVAGNVRLTGGQTTCLVTVII